MDLLALEEKHPGLIDALLGADDETLVREWGFTQAQLHRLRRALLPIRAGWCDGLVPEQSGAPDHPAFARHPGIQHLLGKKSDQEIGRYFGLSRERVRQLRGLVGIPRAPRPAPAPRHPVESPTSPSPLERAEDPSWKGPKSGSVYVARVRERHPGVIEALPSLSTKEIERRFGLNKKAVRYLRAFLEIPSPGSASTD